MRQGIKMTKKYQIFYMLLVQAIATGISLLFTFVAFWSLMDKHIVKEIMSGIFILINCSIIYSYANKFAWYDKRPYTTVQPEPLKGFLMGLVISLSMLIAFIIYKISWLLGANEAGTYLTNGFAIAGNALFMLWSFPYFGIIGMSHGFVTGYSIVLMLVLPIISAVLGYNAGCKDFNILEKFYKFTYVQKKDQKK